MPALQLEIEAKYKISTEQRSTIDQYIKSNNFVPKKVVREADTYYSRPDIDFMVTKECLRIRRSDTYSELTYKPGSTKEMQATGLFWKQELDIDVTGQEEKMHSFLLAIGSIELVTVPKERRAFKKGKVVLALDEIKGLGTFLEIEIITSKDDKKQALKEIESMAKLLKLDEGNLVRLPYRDLLLITQAK